MGEAPGGSRIAFFGGSFDPPHLGHLAVARAARAALGLDTVLFAPVGAQPLKPSGSTAGFQDRVAMTRLAIAGEAGCALSLADAPRATGEPNYTLETLNSLRAELPADCELYCLMGADSLAGLRDWHRAEEIPFAARLIVASRPGQPLDSLSALLPSGVTMDAEDCREGLESDVEVRCCSLIGESGRRAPFYLLPGLDVEISGSRIRQLARARVRAAEGRMAEGGELLPAAVWEYVQEHGLYR